MMPARTAPQQGIALPVMLIILVVMLVSSLYLFRASHSTTLTTATGTAGGTKTLSLSFNSQYNTASSLTAVTSPLSVALHQLRSSCITSSSTVP